MNRSKSYDEVISQRLQDPEYTKGFILTCMEGDDEDAMTLVESVLEVISRMGTKEFAKLVDAHESSISRILSNGDIPKIETLNKLLKPFKLRTRLEVEDVA